MKDLYEVVREYLPKESDEYYGCQDYIRDEIRRTNKSLGAFEACLKIFSVDNYDIEDIMDIVSREVRDGNSYETGQEFWQDVLNHQFKEESLDYVDIGGQYVDLAPLTEVTQLIEYWIANEKEGYLASLEEGE